MSTDLSQKNHQIKHVTKPLKNQNYTHQQYVCLKQHVQVLTKQLHEQHVEIQGLHQQLSQLQDAYQKMVKEKETASKILNHKLVENRRVENELFKHQKQGEKADTMNSILLHEIQSQKEEVARLNNQLLLSGEKIEVLQKQQLVEEQGKVLLQNLNKELQMQIEDLLIQLKIAHRRQETQTLRTYEQKIQENPQLMPLLKQKVVSLQKQLQDANQRCHHLQQLVYQT